MPKLLLFGKTSKGINYCVIRSLTLTSISVIYIKLRDGHADPCNR